MTTPTPAPNSRNRRRHRLIAARMDAAYEAGRRDGRAEATGQTTLPAEYTAPITNRPTPDGTDPQGLRDRIAQVLYPVVHPTKWADHVARWVADDLMPVIAAELDARDTRIAELEADRDQAIDRRDAENTRLRLAWQSARRRALAHRDIARAASRRARREAADLRAQLAATTNPARAEERLAADTHPRAEGSAR